MKENSHVTEQSEPQTLERKKKNKKLAAVIVVLIAVLLILMLFNGYFGNPVSRLLVKRSVSEYLQENYADSDFIIDDISFDRDSKEYAATIVFSENSDEYFHIYTDAQGSIVKDFYEVQVEETVEQNYDYIGDCGIKDFNCKYGDLKDDNRTAEILIELSLWDWKDTEDTTVILKIGDVQLNTEPENSEDGEKIYRAVYESDIFANWYDISGLNVEVTVTNAGDSVTGRLEGQNKNELYNILTDAYLEYLPSIKNRCGENDLSYNYDGEVLCVKGTIELDRDTAAFSEMYVVTEIDDEIVKKEKIDSSQKVCVTYDEYYCNFPTYVAVYAIFEDSEHGYICKYEIDHWVNDVGGIGWSCSDYIYDKNGKLLNEAYRDSADIKDFYEF